MEKPPILCLACNTLNDPSEKVCRKCGLSLSSIKSSDNELNIICPRCGNKNNAGSFFCYTCGKYFVDTDEVKISQSGKVRRSELIPTAQKAILLMPGGSEITLTGSPVFIERSDFDSTLPSDLLMCISRQHVLITYNKGKYYLQDYGRDGKGSTNHTKLNSRDIFKKKRKALKDGDKIEVAGQPELTITFKLLHEEK